MENLLKGYVARVGWLFPLGIFAIAIGFPYIELDDPKHIFSNPLLIHGTLSSLTSLWREPFFGLYIPGTYTAWWGVVQLTGGTPYPSVFHAFNVVLHGVNTYLVSRWIQAHFDTKVLDARLAALVFALHPLTVESVTWISGTKDLLMTTAVLCSLLSLKNHTASLLVAMLAFLASLLMKPASILLPVLLLWVLKAYPISRGRVLLFSSAAFTLSLLIWRVTRGSQEVTGGSLSVENLFIALDSLGFYVSKWVWPSALSLDYGRTPQSVLAHANWGFALTGAVVLLLACVAIAKRTPAATALLLILIAWLPTSGLIPFAYQKFSTVADRYAYVLLIGAAALVALALQRIGRAQGMAMGTIIVLALATTRQIWEWRSSETIFRSSLSTNPQSLLMNTNLGFVLLQQRRFKEAHPYLVRSVAADPSSAGLYVNLATALSGMGRKDEALYHLRRAVALSPKDPWIHEQLRLASGP